MKGGDELMKDLMLSWTKTEKETSVQINNGRERLKIIPEYSNTSSPAGLFIVLANVLEYLGFKKDGNLIDKDPKSPEKGQVIRFQR